MNDREALIKVVAHRLRELADCVEDGRAIPIELRQQAETQSTVNPTETYYSLRYTGYRTITLKTYEEEHDGFREKD